MNLIKKIEIELLEEIKKIEFDFNFKFINGWLVEKELKDRINNRGKQSDNIPFILVRPLRSVQKYKDGIGKRKQDYLIRIVIKDESENGYYKLLDQQEKIVEYFTEHNIGESVDEAFTGNHYGKSYHLNLGINCEINEELTVGDYWASDIIITSYIPIVEAQRRTNPFLD